MNLFDLEKEIIVITGVSGQLGSEYAEALLESGAEYVIGLDLINSDACEVLNDSYKDKFSFIKTDITDKSSIDDASQYILSEIGIPTVLINNAGIDSNPGSDLSDVGPFEEYPEELWDKVLDVNLKGIFLTCQIFGKIMAKNLKGSIINISSIYGIVSPDQSMYEYRRNKGEQFYKPVAYSASKSGVINLTKYLAVYWAKESVRVNTLTIAGVFNDQDQDFLKEYEARIPIGRMADQNEYNGAIIFLSSDASKYMTGSNLIIDGGWTAI